MEDKTTLMPSERQIGMSIAGISCTGKVRHGNEDRFCIDSFYNDEDTFTQGILVKLVKRNAEAVFGVFDGVGGDEHGEWASTEAAKFFSENRHRVEKGCQNSEEIKKLYLEANEAVQLKAEGSATTAAVLCFSSACAYVSNIGDTSIFLFRKRKLKCLTQSHTQQGKVFGRISHRITHYLGEKSDINAYIPFNAEYLPIEDDDVFLLCSDGLTDMVAEESIVEILSETDNEEEAAKKLVKAAMDAGGKDNITVIVVRAFME